MNFETLETRLTGMTGKELAALGAGEASFRECLAAAIGAFLTNMTKHPGGLPYTFGLLTLPVMGNTSWGDVKSARKKNKSIRFQGDRETRKVLLTYYYCPEQYRRNDGKKRVVLMSHGFNSVSTFMLRYWRNYMELGYDCVIFDQRGHKKAADYLCTMGGREAFDLEQIAKFLRQEYGADAIVGIQGESYGSATAYLALPDTSRYTDFTVCDCGYSNMDELARWIEKLLFFYPDKEVLARLIDKMSLAAGFKFSDVKPIRGVRDCPANYPLLMIHGGIDFFVPTHMTKDMYEAKEGKKQMKIYPLAFHALSQALYRKDYHDLVQGFLKDNGFD
ncbi:MAG: alpha/beta fold hydrolase [Clostridia bacterium]|nr:alpha/beta fold hydrolase [Clostridia bacterium]